jgi:exodeoxyribonuclease VII large subunit
MLMHVSPATTVASMQEQVNTLQDASIRQINRLLREGQSTISKNVSMLDALNPLAILQRGYSITRTLPHRSVVRGVNQVTINQSLEILLGRGRLTVTVAEKKNETG